MPYSTQAQIIVHGLSTRPEQPRQTVLLFRLLYSTTYPHESYISGITVILTTESFRYRDHGVEFLGQDNVQVKEEKRRRTRGRGRFTHPAGDAIQKYCGDLCTGWRRLAACSNYPYSYKYRARTLQASHAVYRAPCVFCPAAGRGFQCVESAGAVLGDGWGGSHGEYESTD